MNLKNLTNGYVDALNPGVYDRIPKSVMTAIAVSFATSGGERIEDATEEILHEWQVLYDNGIVPQKPIKEATK